MKISPPLTQGTLLKRYKRFLADVITPEGVPLTIHCPNTGSMKECIAIGAPVWYSTSPNSKRKYPHTLELVSTPAGDIAGINTHRANALVEEAILKGLVRPLQSVKSLLREVKYGEENSRIDFVVECAREQWFVEVKNVTLKEHGQGYFPDAVSKRGAKHLRELSHLARDGKKALLVYCAQHSGISSVAAATHIDAEYANEFRLALNQGVHCIALQAQMAADEIVLAREIPVSGSS